MHKFTIGTPFDTEAVIRPVPETAELPPDWDLHVEEGMFTLRIPLAGEDVVWGLGESVRGINKRGWEYIQNNTDHAEHTETARYLYGAHNYLIVDGEQTFGLFVDCPANTLRFDIGYTDPDQMVISGPAGAVLYVLEGSPKEIVREFRRATGKSYIPPRFGFGYAQSRFEYRDKDTIRSIADAFDSLEIPLDLINLDLDYMQDYKDFTLNREHFEEGFAGFVSEMKERGIHLVPIIDAAIKKEPGDPVYDSGHAEGCFVRTAQGEEFEGAVWPGVTVYPDFLNPHAREWFGSQYQILTDAGIDGFWNDMNEPAIFYSPARLEQFRESVEEFFASGKGGIHAFELMGQVHALQNNPDDYRSFYHETPQGTIRHDLVHNVYGMNMTRASREGLDRLRQQRTLLFSRSSYIGAHRYGGIWTGDNSSWWSHLQLIFHQLPGLNMAGFLYSGCDLGGFCQDTTRDLLLRFLQVGIFTPLMRNHSAGNGRKQEPFRFSHPEDFAFLIGMRYRLIPYLYSEYLKAVEHDDVLFAPLAFEYPEDPYVRQIEDQLLFSSQLMLAPVMEQNRTGRMVYLPEPMQKVRFARGEEPDLQMLPAGWHWVDYPENELVFFLRPHTAIPLAEKALRTSDIDWNQLQLVGDPEASYELYDDDGISLDAPIRKTILT